MLVSLWRKELEICSTSSKLEAEEALNTGLQRKLKELQVRPIEQPNVNKSRLAQKYLSNGNGLMAVNCLQSAQYLSLVDNHLSGLRTGMCLPSATSNLRYLHRYYTYILKSSSFRDKSVEMIGSMGPLMITSWACRHNGCMEGGGWLKSGRRTPLQRILWFKDGEAIWWF